jgi:hypothetical protein
MDPKSKEERDRIARNFAAVANSAQYATVKIDGVPRPSVKPIRLTKEQLEEVRGSESETTPTQH